MAKIVGQIERSFEKDTGSFKYWALVVNGQEYRFGKFAPRGIVEGDWVEFEATSKQNGNYTNWTADYKSIRKTGAGQASEAPAASKPAAPAARGFAPTANDERQEIISRQSAFNTSLAFVKLAIDAGAVAIPSKVKKDQALDYFESVVDLYATKFYNKSTGKTWTIEAAKEEEVDDFDTDTLEDDPAW